MEERFQTRKDRIRKDLLKYTRRAFRMLPPMERPRILDIGCGSGVPTLELARLGGGEVTGIDIEPGQLDVLNAKAEKAGLSHRVKGLKRSMFHPGFPAGSFDIIWAEGSIAVIGFERGLKEWGKLLKPGGYLAVHDDLGDLQEKTGLIPRCGYEMVNHFLMGSDVWWQEYYSLLENEIKEMRLKYPGDRRISELLSSDQQQVDGFRQNPSRYQSVFFIMRRR
jgi:SAM-dependent methyltransferase